LPKGARDFLWIGGGLIGLLAAAEFLYHNELLVFNFTIFFILAEALNAIYGFTGYLPFGFVGFFGTGAYGFALAVMHLGASPWAALALAGGAGLALGLLLTPLLRLSGAYFAIANLAAAQAVYQVIANPALEPLTKGPYGVSLASVFAPRASFFAALALLALLLAVVAWLRRGRIGLALRAIRDDPLSAAMAGIPVVALRVLAWLIAALSAALAGGIFAWHISVFYPETVFDLSFSIFAIVFTLFGGAATLLGPLLGVTLLYGLYNLIGITVPQYFQLIYGALIVALMLFLPRGLLSLLLDRGHDVP
jgi:branched-chain amino acid transport system permease protein